MKMGPYICIFGLTLIMVGCASTRTESTYSYDVNNYDANAIVTSNDYYRPVDNASDNFSPTIDSSQGNATIQEANDINAINASNADVAQQNAADQQQVTQDEINGMPLDNSNQW